MRHFRTEIDRDAIRRFQDEYGPLVCFVENMVHHTLDYRDNPPPPLLGFDVYAPELDPHDQPPPDLYEEHFEGFLPSAVVFGADEDEQAAATGNASSTAASRKRDIAGPGAGFFAAIGLDTAAVLERDLPAEEFNPEGYEIPRSEWTDDVAEGVIVRKDADHCRVRFVTDAFDELNRQRWGPTRRAGCGWHRAVRRSPLYERPYSKDDPRDAQRGGLRVLPQDH